VWNQSSQFEPKKGRFSTWVLSIAHHLSIDHMRRTSRRPRNAEDSAVEHAFATVADPAPAPDEAAWMVERRGVIRAGLSTLPDVQREAIELAYFGGLTQVEIASAQSAPVGTVKTRLALGLKKLADYLSLRGIDLEDALR
jgi:RNA polymerase sigma-70 factor (ECF subfamily)